MAGWIGKVSLWLFSQLHGWRDRIPKLVVIRDTGFAIGNNLFATGLLLCLEQLKAHTEATESSGPQLVPDDRLIISV